VTGAALEWVRTEAEAPRESAVLGLEVAGRRVVVCRAGGRLYALEDRCPHALSPLSAGALRGYTLECPFHGGTLDVRDGRPLSAPIRRPAATYAVRDADGRLEIGLPPEA
jgi:3-phenylpropionate/trans-cinnamate dioxygenase ferredoxin component